MQSAADSADAVLSGKKELQKAQYSFSEARAKRMPSLRLEASASWMSHPPEGIVVPAGSLSALPPIPSADMVFVEDSEPTYFSFSLILDQPIFSSLKLSSAVQMAGLGVDVARFRLLAAKQAARLDAAEAYFGALLAARSIEELSISRSVVQEILTDVEDSFKEGFVKYQAVLEVKKRLAQAETRLVGGEQGLAAALHALQFTTGIDTADLRLTSPFYETEPKLDLAELQHDAVESSLDREILSAGVAVSEKNLILRKGEGLLRPDLALMVQMDVDGGHIPFSETDWDRSWSANLRITIGAKLPIFDSLQAHWGIKAAYEEMEMAKIGLRQLEKALALEVTRTHRELLESYFLLLEKRASLELAAEAYKNAVVSYENGIITRLEEREARLLLAASRLEELAALHRYTVASLRMDYLRGFPQ
jgi:outer membrane protein TolC